MKLTLIAIAALLSGNVLAETCFKADKLPSVESQLPATVCVQNTKFELIIPGLPKNPFYQATVASSVGSKKTEVRFYDFQKAPFKVSVELPVHEDTYGGCSYTYNSSIVVSFLVDEKGNTLENSLSVSALEEESNDPCHMHENETVTNYSRI
jgi:hypothetical protein